MNHEPEPDHDEPSEPAEVSPRALAVLVAHHREFLAFLERRVGDRTLAEELLQEAFSRTDKLASLRDEESAVAWFYRVLRNAVIDHARRQATRSKGLDAFAHELQSSVAPFAEAERAICQCVATLKDALKPEYREALERVELSGMAVKDYASQAGISGSNAAVRVHRARKALRREVQRACGTCAEHGCFDCTCGH